MGVDDTQPLISHLIELRKRLINSILAILVIFLALVYFANDIYQLVSAPLIAVPTSVGYGASFGGLAALLAMLNSCAPGVTVVNIDNGFGAGYASSTINRLGSS